MRLRGSFLHNVIVHPLLFLRDVAVERGYLGVAMMLSQLHDDTEPVECKHEFASTPQEPWTPEAAAMVYHPTREQLAPPAVPKFKPGSVAERMARARGEDVN